MKKAIFPGSFDPITNGHLDIIQRAASVFDELIVVLMENSEKTTLFSTAERLALLQETCKKYPNVQTQIGQGLSVDVARNVQACAIVRGVRTMADFTYEKDMAAINHHLAEDIETILLYASDHLAFVSSSMIREMMKYQQSVDAFVQPIVANALKKKFEIVRK